MSDVIFGELPAVTRPITLLQYQTWLLQREDGQAVVASTVQAEGNMVASNLLTERRNEWWRSGDISTHQEAFDQVWRYDDSITQYTDETTDANDVGADDWEFFPAGAGASDACIMGLSHPSNKITVNVGTVGTGAYVVTYKYWNGTALVALSNVVDGTNGFKTSGSNTIAFDEPTDWVSRVLSSGRSLYYIHAERDGGTETAQPLGTQGFIHGLELVFAITLGTNRAFNWLSYHWSNNLLPWKVILWDKTPVSGGVILKQSNTMNPVVKAHPGDFTFDEMPTQLGPTAEERATLAANMMMSSFVELDETVYGVGYVEFRFDIRDGANGAADYLQLSHPRGGLRFQPQYGTQHGTSLSPVSLSEVHVTKGGGQEGVGRPTLDQAKYTFPNVTDAEGMELFADWVKGQGELGKVFFWWSPQPERRRDFYRGGAFMGVLKQFSELAIDKHPGRLGAAFVTMTVNGVTITETR